MEFAGIKFPGIDLGGGGGRRERTRRKTRRKTKRKTRRKTRRKT